MKYNSTYIWEQGKRACNQDAFCVQQIAIGGAVCLLAVICDGIGSLSEGENASTTVTGILQDSFHEIILNKRKYKSLKAVKRILSKKLYRLHLHLQLYAAKKQIQIGTTLCMLYLYKNRFLIIHVGDSRIYTGKRRLHCITKDDCDRMGRLKRCIGNGTAWTLHCKMGHFYKKQYMLLCSDGFYRSNEREIKQIPRECHGKHKREILQKTVFYLYENACRNQETDNISAILIQREG